jgi:DMSO reductase anchor subunit
MIYIDTRRPAWSAWVVLPRFFGTALLAAMAGGLVGNSHAAVPVSNVGPWALGFLAFFALTCLAEFIPLFRARPDPSAALHGVIRRLEGPLRLLWQTRIGLAAAGALLLVALNFLPVDLHQPWSALVGVVLLAGVVLERYGFFMACPAPRMPGGIES